VGYGHRPVKVLFATAEFTPLARVGGLAEASAGLVGALRALGHDVDLVLPDYSGRPLRDEAVVDLVVPEWAAPARARRGVDAEIGVVTLVDVPGIRRPHPYLETGSGQGWSDNDRRFLAYSAAVGALAAAPVDGRPVDIVHVNDWHAAAALAFIPERMPSILTVHTLGYQGTTGADWADRLGRRGEAFRWHGATNPLAGGIRLADRVVAVSPTYAREITGPMFGFGLHDLLAGRGDDLVGIRNGIDTELWDPTTGAHVPAPYDAEHLAGKVPATAALRERLGLPATADPVVGVVTRLVDQKGVDLVLDAVPYLDGIPAQLAMLGTGDPEVARRAHEIASRNPDRFAFTDAYDEGLAHLVFAGSDLYLMPSRFEPCGLSQMQAMRYGSIPVVSAVGGLRDTVTDADAAPASGNGFVMRTVDLAGVVDATHRAARGWLDPARRDVLRRRGMLDDWSWRAPVLAYLDEYAVAIGRHPALVEG
jgi:starch synthase